MGYIAQWLRVYNEAGRQIELRLRHALRLLRSVRRVSDWRSALPEVSQSRFQPEFTMPIRNLIIRDLDVTAHVSPQAVVLDRSHTYPLLRHYCYAQRDGPDREPEVEGLAGLGHGPVGRDIEDVQDALAIEDVEEFLRHIQMSMRGEWHCAG